MPYQFALPTTSSFSFSSSFTSESHPSLPLNASIHRGVVRDALKKFKRLPPSLQGSALPSIVSKLTIYLPYAFAIDAGLSRASQQEEEINVVLISTPAMQWRPTLSGNSMPRKETPRGNIQSLEYDLFFTLLTLGCAYTLLARASLHPLYATSGTPMDIERRRAAITTASKHLMDAASIHDYLACRAEALSTPPPCVDITQPTSRALASLALAEATLLAVLKDDPYPAVVAQDRNEDDREWMYKAPEIPKVRAHLFARLCLAAADHAAQASSLCQSVRGKGGSKFNDDLLRYLEDLRKTSRAKACRFFGIDAELSGQTGQALGWLRCGLQELGLEPRDANKKGLSLSRMKKEWSERREDRKVERGTNWGSDAGKLEETRVIDMLDVKWTKVNDTMLSQTIPAPATLLSSLPSGRDINIIKPFQPPELSRQSLESMRALPDRADDYGGDQPSSDDERTAVGTPIGAFPGTSDNYRSESTRSYY